MTPDERIARRRVIAERLNAEARANVPTTTPTTEHDPVNGYADDDEISPPDEPDEAPDDTAAEEPPDDDSRSGEHSGQLRIANRLAAAYAGRLLHVHGIGWHRWDGTRWALDDGGHAIRAVIQVLKRAIAETVGAKKGSPAATLRRDVRKCESANAVAGVLTLAAVLRPFAATVRDLDADPYLLNCANGTLDLRTMDVRDHDPADRITKVTRAAYRINTKSVAWQQFLDKVLPDEQVRGYLQRLTGLALLGKVMNHVLPILTGKGANGKGTWYGAVLWALGDYAAVAEPDLFMLRQGAHPTGEMDLLGRRLVVVSESEKDRCLDEAKMKRLTGGDLIKARKMRQDFVEFPPSHLVMLITNHLPKVSGDDEATWRRLRVIPFDVVIPKVDQDEHLDEQLHLEADAVLAWVVAGWQDYRDAGENTPADVIAATGTYRLESDAVGRFITDNCVTSSLALKSTTDQLYKAWEPWAKADGTPEMSRKAFGLALDRHGYPVTNPARDGRWREGIAVKVGDA